eukprot:s1327_g4.t4
MACTPDVPSCGPPVSQLNMKVMSHAEDAVSPAVPLEVRPSLLGEDAGNGLFVLQAVSPGEVLCEYRGRLLCTSEAMRLENKSYLMRIGPQEYIDAREELEVLARFINDCRNPAVYNVRFEKRPGEGRAMVVAVRPISAGEELFVDYGRWYWASLRPKQLAVKHAAEILQAVEAAKEAAAQQWPRPTAAELEALSHPALDSLELNASPSEDLNLNLAQRLGGLIDHWKARRWSQEHWLQNFGHLKFRLRPCTSLHHYGYAGPAERFVSLEEYLTSDTFNRKFVLFENDFDAERLEILDGFAVPELLAGIHGAPIFSVGRKDTGVGFHRHSPAWLAQLQGRKLWLLVPGGRRPPERPPWQYLTQKPKQLICGVAHPGEIVFVPAGWWHATWNLDDVVVAAGWEKGGSGLWGPEMHAIADGDAVRLTAMDFEVSLPALSLAARSGRMEILELLLQRDATPSTLLQKDAPSIAIAAARSGHVDILSHLWNQGITSLLQASRVSGSTALHEASRCGRLDVLRWLLCHSADCRQMDADGSEALQVAAEFGHATVVEVLLQCNAHIDAQNAKGFSALMLSARNGHSAVVQLLCLQSALHLQDAKGRMALHHAAMRGHEDVVTSLLKASADVDPVDASGRTPLHLSTLGLIERDATSEKIEFVEDAHLPVVRILLHALADVNLQDDLGKSPVDYAAESMKGARTLIAMEHRRDSKGSVNQYETVDSSPSQDMASLQCRLPRAGRTLASRLSRASATKLPCMSAEEILEENRLLRERVRFLESEIRRLTEGRLHPTTQAAEIWEVVEEERFSDCAPVLGSARFSVEDGPPELPVVCRNLAEQQLKKGKYTPVERAEAAFKTGFWIRVAIETSTPFTDHHSLKGLASAQWVVFRGALGGLPVRSVRKADCLKALWEEADRILIPVASLTELHIVCDPSTLVLSLASDEADDDLQFFAVPIAVREGGILLAVPVGTFSEAILASGQDAEEPAVVGPSTRLEVELLEEDEETLEVIRTGVQATTVCVDLTDGIISSLREYDPVTDSQANIRPFLASHPLALPYIESVLPDILSWAESAAARANFYSAREEQTTAAAPKRSATVAGKKAGGAPKRPTNAHLAEQVQALSSQMAALMESQKIMQEQLLGGQSAKAAGVQSAGGVLSGPKLPALSSSLSPPKGVTLSALAKSLGPPPRTKALYAGLGTSLLGAPAEAEEPLDVLQETEQFATDPMLAALTQQSAAVTALVAHLASGGDAMTDLHGVASGSPGASTKGLQRRQKLQADLAGHASSFFLQLHQQMHRKMHPAKAVPQKEEDLLSSQVGMCNYLERFGNFRMSREVGLTMWVLGHAIDASAQGDHALCREFLALLALALEQVATDGDWRIAYHLTLLEDPPPVMFQQRPQAVSAVGKPFANLVPPSLAAITLAYIKEVDVLVTKKSELKSGRSKAGNSGDQEEDGANASPKRKPRFPRRPKNNEEGGS